MKELIQEVISRLEQRKTECYKSINPYYEKPQDEWLELKIKIAELEKLKQKY